MIEIKVFQPNGPQGALPLVEPHSPEVLDGPAPKQYRHLYIHDKAHALKAGIWRCTPFATKLVRQRSHELVVVVEGEVIIIDRDDREWLFKQGESFILPGGVQRRWVHRDDATVYCMSYEGSDLSEAAALPIRIDPDAVLAPSPPPADDMLLTERPTTNIKRFYEDPTKTWSSGVWDATPYHRKIMPFPRYEFMHLLVGEVSFTGESGETQTFKKGDTFVIPPGVVCNWKSSTYVRKVFCVFLPPV
jgi:uncharacterized cupin superfamily protein